MSGAQVYVYYCQYSGRHALTTSCNLNGAPKRRTDGARVIDTQKDKVRGRGVGGRGLLCGASSMLADCWQASTGGRHVEC